MSDSYARHSLSASDIERVGAGAVTPRLIERLKGVVISRNIAILEYIRRRSEPGSAVHDLIGGLWRRSTSTEALLSPRLGVWAEETLRTGGAGDPTVLQAALKHEDKRVRVGVGSRALFVEFGIDDPLCGHFRLNTSHELGRGEWMELIRQAWSLLIGRHRPIAEGLAATLTTIVPVSAPPPFSASSAAAFGAVAIAPPTGAGELAASLTHELQHHILGAVEEIADLTWPRHPARFPVYWRDTLRDPAATLQGVLAHTAVAALHRAEWLARPCPSGLADATAFALWRRASADALDLLMESGALTPTGRVLATAIRDRLRPWLAEPLPASALQRGEALLEARWRVNSSSARYRD